MSETELSKNVQEIVKNAGKQLLVVAIETGLTAATQAVGAVMDTENGRKLLEQMQPSIPRTISEQDLVDIVKDLQQAQAVLDHVNVVSQRYINAFMVAVDLMKAYRQGTATAHDLLRLEESLLAVDPDCLAEAQL